MGPEIVGIEPDNLIEIGNGAIEFAFVEVEETAIVVGRNIFGIDLDGLSEVF